MFYTMTMNYFKLLKDGQGFFSSKSMPMTVVIKQRRMKRLPSNNQSQTSTPKLKGGHLRKMQTHTIIRHNITNTVLTVHKKTH